MLERQKSSESSSSQHGLLQAHTPRKRSDLYNVAELKKTERKVIHDIKVRLFKLLALSAGAIVASYVWNLVMPDSWCWLSPDRMQLLKDQALSILTGLGVGLVLSLMHEK